MNPIIECHPRQSVCRVSHQWQPHPLRSPEFRHSQTIRLPRNGRNHARQGKIVDLFNAETSSMLAWTLYMLGDEIDKKEKGLSNSVRKEIEYRFLHPTLYNKQGWKANANNWNTWITTNWLQTVLICEQDATDKKESEDAKHLAASIAKVQMTDGIMKTQWKDNVYRIILRLNDNYPKARVKYRFVNNR